MDAVSEVEVVHVHVEVLDDLVVPHEGREAGWDGEVREAHHLFARFDDCRPVLRERTEVDEERKKEKERKRKEKRKEKKRKEKKRIRKEKKRIRKE